MISKKASIDSLEGYHYTARIISFVVVIFLLILGVSWFFVQFKKERKEMKFPNFRIPWRESDKQPTLFNWDQEDVLEEMSTDFSTR